MSSRLKREECKRTKHDSIFSKWEILIGPSDWEDHSLGKDGAERYRIHNLPIGCSCPGIYELGVDSIPTDGHRSANRASDDIVVVYLGQADNVRTRLQHYGRAGSHLDHGNKRECLSPKSGPGLFKEIFSRGYSIMFRWAPMMNKKEAGRTEAQLLGVFDYAWNRSGNGTYRREDILLKLDNRVSGVLRKFQQWRNMSFGKKVGIEISSGIPLDEAGWWKSFVPQVRKFLGSRAQLVQQDDGDICGVALGYGSVCRNRPVLGRKRCEDHKGKKISGGRCAAIRELTAAPGNSAVCGVVLEDGSLCVESPVHARKRCELHKGKRVA